LFNDLGSRAGRQRRARLFRVTARFAGEFFQSCAIASKCSRKSAGSFIGQVAARQQRNAASSVTARSLVLA
jgi:hypothetical protein